MTNLLVTVLKLFAAAQRIFIFVLPPDSGEKIALGITVLLAFSVFVLAIAEKMPETSDSMPLIGIYLTVVMGMTSVSVVMTVLVLNFHHRGPFNEAVPHWIRVLVLDRLKRILRMTLPHAGGPSKVCSSFSNGNGMMRRMSVRMAMDDMKNDVINECGPDLLINGGYEVNGRISPPRRESLLLEVPQAEFLVDRGTVTRKRRRSAEELQAKLIKTLQVLIRRQQKEDASEKMANEWRQVAQVIDRLLFWIFLIATFTITLVLLVIIPALYRPFAELDSH